MGAGETVGHFSVHILVEVTPKQASESLGTCQAVLLILALVWPPHSGVSDVEPGSHPGTDCLLPSPPVSPPLVSWLLGISGSADWESLLLWAVGLSLSLPLTMLCGFGQITSSVPQFPHSIKKTPVFPE